MTDREEPTLIIQKLLGELDELPLATSTVLLVDDDLEAEQCTRVFTHKGHGALLQLPAVVYIVLQLPFRCAGVVPHTAGESDDPAWRNPLYTQLSVLGTFVEEAAAVHFANLCNEDLFVESEWPRMAQRNSELAARDEELAQRARELVVDEEGTVDPAEYHAVYTGLVKKYLKQKLLPGEQFEELIAALPGGTWVVSSRLA